GKHARRRQGRGAGRFGDVVPEAAQPLHPLVERAAGDDRGVDRADRNAGQPVRGDAGRVQPLVDAALVTAERAAALQDQGDGRIARQVAGDGRVRPDGAVGGGGHGYCMNQPWLTTMLCPVSALLSNAARVSATLATSSTVVNSPSTVSRSITSRTTASSLMPSSRACSGICWSTSGLRTKPGQITFARTPAAAPSLATVRARPSRPCLAVT